MSYTIKSVAAGILQQQTLLQPCSIHPFRLQVDGRLFNTTLSEDGELIGVDSSIQSSIALSLFYDNNTTVYSNGVDVTANASSFFTPLRNHSCLVPVYNYEEKQNSAFLPVLYSMDIQNNLHYMIFTAFAEIENQSKFDIIIRSGTFHYSLHPHEKKPYYTQSIGMKEDSYSFQVSCSLGKSFVVHFIE